MVNEPRKRQSDNDGSSHKRNNLGNNNENRLSSYQEDEENLIFEDPFGDEMEEDEIIHESNSQTEDMDMDDAAEEDKTVTKVWRAGVDPIGKDEVLDYDSSAYDLYHSMTAEWPSLSFDVIPDKLGECRTKFPMTLYLVAGTQADRSDSNSVTVMKMSELHRCNNTEDSDNENENDEDHLDDDPILESRTIKHKGGVNRIRVMPQCSNIVATWADTGKVHLWDISKQLASLDGNAHSGMSTNAPPHYTFSGHPEEGFAMDWSPTESGRFLSGDCKKFVYLWNPTNSTWNVDKIPFTGHTQSVEDIQWSPTEASVFASCSVDQTIRIWDTRKKAGSMIDVHAHSHDVNVISWNRNVSYLLVSGSDDGSFKIWDLRNFKANQPVANFRYHTSPITSVEWHPTDESVLAVSSEDNQITVWDMSVEADTESGVGTTPASDLPPQLLFVHQGQTDVKELHFHRQCPGVIVSTASDGYNVFKPSNIS